MRAWAVEKSHHRRAAESLEAEAAARAAAEAEAKAKASEAERLEGALAAAAAEGELESAGLAERNEALEAELREEKVRAIEAITAAEASVAHARKVSL